MRRLGRKVFFWNARKRWKISRRVIRKTRKDSSQKCFRSYLIDLCDKGEHVFWGEAAGFKMSFFWFEEL